jgi:hypothetical protein
MTTLKMATHAATGQELVEIYDDHGRLLGCIYPHRDGIHIVSKHFADDPVMPSIGMVPVPGYLMRLKS